MKKIEIYFLFLVYCIPAFVYAQELPPIQVFTPQDYNAEDQNWSISQSDNNFIYIANNQGLLEYNGATWELYPSPNNEILRSVKVVDQRIYTGGYRDFGYWFKNNHGKLVYTSLITSTDIHINEDEEFWGIINYNEYIIFQSFERIYIYNGAKREFKIIDSDQRINKVFSVDETIYYQKIGSGIYKLENGNESLLITNSQILNEEIINIFSQDDGLLLVTKEKGLYKFRNNLIENWAIEADKLLADAALYSSIKLSNGDIILGTISKGILHIDANGYLLNHIDQSYGLSNNTVLALKEDSLGNVWLGLDNGINVINFNSPFRVYKDNMGALGTVYASASFNGNLYLGTNQGLFFKKLNSDSPFVFIEGTKGQVLCLENLYGTLFCGHDVGTFIVKGNKVEKISNALGAWAIKKIEGKPNLLIQGNYKGLNILHKVGNKWTFRNKLVGFNISSRYLEFLNPKELFINHEYRGVYKLSIDENMTTVIDFVKTDISQGVKSSIVNYNNSLIYNYRHGCYSYDDKLNYFQEDSTLTNIFSGTNYVSGKLITDKEKNRLWGFNKNEIIYIQPSSLTQGRVIKSIPIPSEIRKTKPGYENVSHLNDNNYLFGTTEGYFVVNLNKLEQYPNSIYLNSIFYNQLHDELISIDKEQSISLKSTDNNIRFNVSVPNYNKLQTTHYQYRLVGLYDNWSVWSTNSEIIFENLPHGNYKFEARAKTGGILSNNIISYEFYIQSPWYLNSMALMLYVVLALGLGFLVHYFNKRYYKIQKQKLIEKKERESELEQLENQRQLMQFKNENLTLDIENKNRELGMATMNLVKRNELLNNIKVALNKSKSKDDIKKVVKSIDSSINDTSDWKLFEEAFNNVDKNFMKKVKSLHPKITSNDLRLCAYLRLNLSSKEIAPLLNISHKSVEVKRYRLRKKMGLDHDENLTNYILQI